MLRAIVWVSLAAVFCAVSVPGIAGVIELPGEEPQTVDVPSEEYPTIQSAIDALPNRSTIRLSPGRYTEAVTIVDKRVNLVGSGAFCDTPTEIVGDDPGAPVITFGPRGGGAVEDLVVRDGVVGICGVSAFDPDGTEVFPSAVLIQESYVHHVGYGIWGSFGDIAVTDSTVRKVKWNGVCLLWSETLTFLNSVVSNAGNLGMLIFNASNEGESPILISGTDIMNNDQGGVAIVGDAKPVSILDCFILNSSLVGIFLVDVGQVEIRDTYVSVVHLSDTPGHGDIGDGLLACAIDSKPFIEVDNCWFMACARAGMLFVDCDGSIENTDSFANDYGLVLQGSPKPLVGEGNSFDNNTEESIVTDGDLPVPDEPLPVPDPL